MAPTYEIYIRDRHLNRVGVITHYSKLEIKSNFNDAGGWTLDMPDNNISDTNTMKRVFRDPNNQGLSGVIVVRNGNVIFSGGIRGFEASAEYDSNSQEKSIKFFGMDDTAWLRSRLCYVEKSANPVENYTAPDARGWGYDIVASQPAEDVMLHLVKTNIAENAKHDGTYGSRKLPYLVTTTNPGGRGANMEKSKFRFQNLMDKLIYCANIGNLGFRIIQTAPQLLDFQIYVPKNKTSTAIFSLGFGNLGSYRYKIEAPVFNFGVGAGQNLDSNDPTTRYFDHAGDDSPPVQYAVPTPTKNKYGVWEEFIDRRDTDIENEIHQAVYNKLIENTEVVEVEANVINIPPTEFWKNYNLGDKVTVVIDNTPIRDIVRSVTIELTKEDGEVITPTIGTPGASTTFRLYDKIDKVNKRVTELETNY